MTSSFRPLAVAIAALIGLLLAGCASGPDGTTDGGSASDNSSRDKTVKFAECMRGHGVTAFPDPDASGSLTIDEVLNGSSLDPDSPRWKGAMKACQHLQPPGFTGKKRSAAKQEEALKFAQCVRDHGVTDFPDPVEGDPLVNTDNIPSTDEEGGMTILDDAMHVCGKVYAGELGLKGP